MEYAVSQTPPPEGTAQATGSSPTSRLRLGATAWIALGITVVVLVATLIVLLAGNQAQATYPANSPEAALQRYLTAWYDKDYNAAYEFFASDVQGQMSLSDFRRDAGFAYGPDNQTVTLDRTTGSGDSRTLHLIVEDYYGPQYGGSGYSHGVQVRMTLEPDGWKIDDPLIGLEPYYGYPY